MWAFVRVGGFIQRTALSIKAFVKEGFFRGVWYPGTFSYVSFSQVGAFMPCTAVSMKAFVREGFFPGGFFPCGSLSRFRLSHKG